MITLDVRPDIKQVKKNLNIVQRSVIPKVTAKALNETASAHRTVGVKQVAKDIRLPQRILLNRLNSQGKIKAKRTYILKAYRNKLWATIGIYDRGIPVIQTLTAGQKNKGMKRPPGGLKAAGGRVYRRGFLARPRGTDNLQVFARRGKSRLPLFVPKIGIRKRVKTAYDKALKATGSTVFSKRFRRLIDYEVARLKR